MKIYTGRVGDKIITDQPFEGLVIDTTVKTAGTEIGKLLAPTWELVMGLKRGMGVKQSIYPPLVWNEYVDKYITLMRERFNSNRNVFRDFIKNNDEVMLLCYCRAGQCCHRRLLAAKILPAIAQQIQHRCTWEYEYCQPTTMFGGSREASDEMIAHARLLVQESITRGENIIVGDASGIDQAVIDECALNNHPCTVYGISAKGRADIPYYMPYEPVKGSYTQRDRLIIDLANRCEFIWNGSSKGTEAAIKYASRFGAHHVYVA